MNYYKLHYKYNLDKPNVYDATSFECVIGFYDRLKYLCIAVIFVDHIMQMHPKKRLEFQMCSTLLHFHHSPPFSIFCER